MRAKKTVEAAEMATTAGRAALEAAIMDINLKLDLEDPIKIAGSDDSLVKALVAEGNAPDGGFYEKDPLEKVTFAVLKACGVKINPGAAIGAMPPPVVATPPPTQAEAGNAMKEAPRTVKTAPKTVEKAKPGEGSGSKKSVVPGASAAVLVKAGADVTKAAGLPPSVKVKKVAKRAAVSGKIETPDDGVITKLVEENPHRKGTKVYEWFKIIRTGITVKKAIEKGVRDKMALYHFAREGKISIASKK